MVYTLNPFLRPTAKWDESWLKEVYSEEVGDVDILSES